MSRRDIWAALGVLATGFLAAWLIGHYDFFTRHSVLGVALGYSLPLVYLLVMVWVSRARQVRTGQPHPAARQALVIWFVVAWALIALVFLARWVGVRADWVSGAKVIVLMAAGAGFCWVAYAYLGYRFARLTRQRAAIAALLTLVLAVMVYTGWQSSGTWGSLAGFFWMLVVIAIFLVLRRPGPAREREDE